MKRRDFHKRAGMAGAGAVLASNSASAQSGTGGRAVVLIQMGNARPMGSPCQLPQKCPCLVDLKRV